MAKLSTSAAAAAIVLLLGGCGGGGDGGNGADASPTASGEKAEKAPASARLQLQVAGVGRAGEQPEFGSETRVEAEDAVRLLVDVRGTGDARAPVRISIPKTAARELEVKASLGEKEEQVTIRSAGDKKISLEALRYSCTLPPQTVCPAEDVRVTDDAYEMTFSIAEPGPPLGLSAVVS
jgi:hypothetical protein